MSTQMIGIVHYPTYIFLLKIEQNLSNVVVVVTIIIIIIIIDMLFWVLKNRIDLKCDELSSALGVGLLMQKRELMDWLYGSG